MRKKTRNSPGLGIVGVGTALATATALAPTLIPGIMNLFKKDQAPKYRLDPSTYAANYAATVQAKAAEAIAAQQARQAEAEARTVEAARKGATTNWLLIGGIGVLVIGGAIILMRKRK